MRDMVADAGKKVQWGVKTYQNIKKKEDDIKAGKSVTLAPRKTVREFLEAHLVITGPLDATNALFELSIEDQCSFFSSFPRCETLLLRSWKSIAQKTLRCISMTMGERLLELDLSYSNADVETLEILLVHLTRIQTLKFSHCSNIDGLAMATLAKLNGNTVKELVVDHCVHFKSEPLLALSGQIGVVGSGLRRLEVLDLGFSPVQDRGLLGIGKGCSKLKFLNLQNCSDVTDTGVIEVVKSNPQLQLLCLFGCSLLTDKSAKIIGKYCSSSLTSLNLSLCARITNTGISSIANGCSELQNANFSGILKLTEENLVELATNCQGLLMLNVTGCEEITPNGLKALIRGLKYVEAGSSFVGFKPKDKHVEQKINDYMSFLHNQAICIIRDGFDKRQWQKLAFAHEVADRLEEAALQIQQSYRSYRHRMFFMIHLYK